MDNNDPQAPYTGNGQQEPPPYHPDGHPYGQQSYRQGGYSSQRPPKPESYLVLSIIATIFGFMPFGIVAIVFAAKVDNLYYRGDLEAALQAAQDAKKWSIISLACTAAFIGLWIIVIILFLAGVLASLPMLT